MSRDRDLGCGGLILVGGAVLAIFSIIGKSPDSSGSGQSSSAGIQPGTVNQQGINSLVSELKTHPWTYNKSSDSLSGRSIISASVTSDNSVDFSPPYDGGSSLEIYLRKHPRSGTDVIASVNKGQIVCDVSEGCPIHVSFDNGKVQRFTGLVPTDYNSKAIFLRPAASFISDLKRSKKAVIEVEFYEQGRQQFTFNVQNLHWLPQKSDY